MCAQSPIVFTGEEASCTLSGLVSLVDRLLSPIGWSMHCCRVALYCRLIAKRLGLPQLTARKSEVVGAVHDLGKYRMPQAVWDNRQPGLPPDLESIMRTHPAESEAILSQLPWPAELRDVPALARQHHERLDGTGYPDHLHADALAQPVRVVMVADTFDAATTDRGYKPKLSLPDGLAVLQQEAARGHLDADAARALTEVPLVNLLQVNALNDFEPARQALLLA